MPKHFASSEAVPQGSDAQYSCVFVESAEGQAQLDGAAITAIAATLIDVTTQSIINNRSDQNVKDLNGGTLESDGTFTLQLGADDNIIHGSPAPRTERHRLSLAVTFNRTGGGQGTLNHDVYFYVRNLEGV